MKGGVLPGMLEMANGHFLRGLRRMHPRCSAEVRMAKALLHFFRDRAAMKQSGRRTAGAAVRLGCIFRRKNRSYGRHRTEVISTARYSIFTMPEELNLSMPWK